MPLEELLEDEELELDELEDELDVGVGSILPPQALNAVASAIAAKVAKWFEGFILVPY